MAPCPGTGLLHRAVLGLCAGGTGPLCAVLLCAALQGDDWQVHGSDPVGLPSTAAASASIGPAAGSRPLSLALAANGSKLVAAFGGGPAVALDAESMQPLAHFDIAGACNCTCPRKYWVA